MFFEIENVSSTNYNPLVFTQYKFSIKNVGGNRERLYEKLRGKIYDVLESGYAAFSGEECSIDASSGEVNDDEQRR